MNGSLVEVITEAAHRPRELLDHAAVGIAVVDAKHALQHLNDRMERHRTSERERVSLDPRRRRPELSAELMHQTRLADARLADEQDDLAMPGVRPFEALVEQAQLLLASDEATPSRLGCAHHQPYGWRRAGGVRERPELEASVQEPRGVGAGDHCPRRGPLQRGLEGPAHVVAGVGVQIDALAAAYEL
jgi:hypothetical protein